MERFDADAVVLAVGVKAVQQCATPPTCRLHTSRLSSQTCEADRARAACE